jgi:proteasome lid subunit RPN8/RPN11
VAEAARVADSLLEEMSAETARRPEIECCGLLGGQDGIITRIYPAANALASATAYEIAPEDLFRIMRQMRADRVHPMGVYHSHPSSENFPSPTDVANAFYPEAIYFIASPFVAQVGANSGRLMEGPIHDPAISIRAFRIRGGIVTELGIELMTVSVHAP